MSEIIRCTAANESCERYVHSSGVTVYMRPMEGYSTATAQIAVRFGSMDNSYTIDGKRVDIPDGTAHYLEHKLFESEDKDAFKLFAKTGASSNAGTGHESTVYYFTASHGFEESLEILLNFVTSPYFTPENVEKERGIIGQEIAMYDDSPNWRLLLQLLHGIYVNNPVRNDIAGTAESISHITDKMLYEVYEAFYHPQNMALVIVGNFDPDRARAIIDRCLKPKPPVQLSLNREQEPHEAAEKYAECEMPVAKPLFAIGFKRDELPAEKAMEDTLYFDLLFEIMFGEMSDFYMNMRDSGLINDEFSTGTVRIRGTVLPTITGESDDPERVRAAVMETIRHFKQTPPDKEVFLRLKKQIHGDNIRTFNNVEAYAQLLTDMALAGAAPYAAAENAAAADYQTMLEKLSGFDEENSCMSVVRPC